jgi:two-component system LytT family response regulator
MRVLIVDDEPLAREGLRLLLAAEPDLSLCGECGNGLEAVQAIGNVQPDLVFLDINMPGLTGLEVVAEVGINNMPLVIFLTAYDQHAVEAFTLNALDYLLKPVAELRLRESLQRARSKLQQRQLQSHQQQLGKMLAQLTQQTTPAKAERLMIRSASHVYFVKPADITWVEADGDYVSIHTNGKKHLVRETMKQMEERLAAQGFQRIHRSSLVNLEAIRELVADHNGDYQVILHDSTALKLSRTYRDELCEKLQCGVQQEPR